MVYVRRIGSDVSDSYDDFLTVAVPGNILMAYQ
jgi:hypothetical protein